MMMLAVGAMLALTACQKVDIDGETETRTKAFTFTLKGDFTEEYHGMGSRGYLRADGKDMTDLWVVDMMDGVVKQTLHQASADADFGVPTLQLAYGAHTVLFCASRGVSPVWSADKKGIQWTKASDTFWKAYDVEVVKTSNGNRAVTLERAVSRLDVMITDVVPVGVAKIRIALSQGADAVSLLSGFGTMGSIVREWDITGDVGKVLPGMLIYTLCPSAEEWQTDVTMQYLDAGGNVLHTRKAEGVRMKRNRETSLTGTMVDASNGFTVGLSTEWEEENEEEF